MCLHESVYWFILSHWVSYSPLDKYNTVLHSILTTMKMISKMCHVLIFWMILGLILYSVHIWTLAVYGGGWERIWTYITPEKLCPLWVGQVSVGLLRKIYVNACCFSACYIECVGCIIACLTVHKNIIYSSSVPRQNTLQTTKLLIPYV